HQTKLLLSQMLYFRSPAEHERATGRSGPRETGRGRVMTHRTSRRLRLETAAGAVLIVVASTGAWAQGVDRSRAGTLARRCAERLVRLLEQGALTWGASRDPTLDVILTAIAGVDTKRRRVDGEHVDAHRLPRDAGEAARVGADLVGAIEHRRDVNAQFGGG